ncbi:13087_t:CDS:2, partial [Dentiscutata erythropus]
DKIEEITVSETVFYPSIPPVSPASICIDSCSEAPVTTSALILPSLSPTRILPSAPPALLFYNLTSIENNKFISDLITVVNNGFDGIDINYPFKLPCNPFNSSYYFDFNYTFLSFVNATAIQLGNKNLMITAGQYPVYGINFNSSIISFVNIQNDYIDSSKLVLDVKFGGIIEIVSSNNIKSDIDNQLLQQVNDPNFKFSFPDEQILNQYNYSSYAYWTYDYQSLNAKLDFVKSSNLAEIAIADITKDSKNLRLTNFILGIQPNRSSNTSPSSTPFNTDPIVGGTIGSLVFVSALVAAGLLKTQSKFNAKDMEGGTFILKYIYTVLEIKHHKNVSGLADEDKGQLLDYIRVLVQQQPSQRLFSASCLMAFFLRDDFR